MLPVDGSRVVTVSSVGHRIRRRIHFDDLQLERKYNRVAAYGQSKLANLMFTYELQRRLTAKGAPTIALAAHPGVADTELLRNMPGGIRQVSQFVWRPSSRSPPTWARCPPCARPPIPARRAASTTDPAASARQKGHPKVVESSAQSHDEDIQRRLWTVSEELTGVTFPV